MGWRVWKISLGQITSFTELSKSWVQGQARSPEARPQHLPDGSRFKAGGQKGPGVGSWNLTNAPRPTGPTSVWSSLGIHVIYAWATSAADSLTWVKNIPRYAQKIDRLLF